MKQRKRYMQLYKMLFIVFAGGGAIINAQILPCGAAEYTPSQMQVLNEQLNQEITLGLSPLSSGVIIPVAFHIIHDNGIPHVSDDMIYEQLNVLNTNFSTTNFQFVLHTITRNNRPEWVTIHDGNDSIMKQTLAIASRYVLNFYLCPNPDGAGYSTFPWQYSEEDYRHGIVVATRTLPRHLLP